MNPKAKAIREAMMAAVEKIDPKTPISLSGGVDSATILAASLALCRKPDLYSFRLGENDSRDVQVARRMAAHFKLRHVVVSIPQDDETLIRDIKRVIGMMPLLYKTHVQCCHPFLYLCEAWKRDGYDRASFAMGADDLLGTSRYVTVGIKSHDESWARRERWLEFYNPLMSDISVVSVCSQLGITMIDPYRDPRVSDVIQNIDFKELHYLDPAKPANAANERRKIMIVRAFPEFWGAGAWWRNDESLQVVSGVLDWHDTILNTALNTRGAKTVLPIYNDIAKELGVYERQKREERRRRELREQVELRLGEDGSIEGLVDERKGQGQCVPRGEVELRLGSNGLFR